MCTNININKGSTYLRVVALRRKLLSPRDLRGFAEESHRVPQRTQILAASIGRNRELSKLLESACFAGFALDLAYYKKEIPEMPNLFLTRPYQPDQNRSGFTPGDPRSSSPLICNN